MLKNVLIVVDDIEKSIEFYKDLFGLQVSTHLVLLLLFLPDIHQVFSAVLLSECSHLQEPISQVLQLHQLLALHLFCAASTRVCALLIPAARTFASRHI